MFLTVQVFQDPGFSGYRFFWVQVFQGLSPDFRSSPKVDCHFKLFTFTSWYFWLQFSFKRQHKKYTHQYANFCFQRSFSKAEDTLWNISFRLFHETQFNAYFITHNWISWNSCKICKKESYLNYHAFFCRLFYQRWEEKEFVLQGIELFFYSKWIQNWYSLQDTQLFDRTPQCTGQL